MVFRAWSKSVRFLELVEALKLRFETVEVDFRANGGQVVAVHRAPDLLLDVVEDAG